MDLEASLKRLLASAPQTIYAIQTLQFSHSAMSQTFHLWKETYVGTTTIEGGVVVNMLPANFEIDLAGSEGNLDQSFDIKLGLVDIQDIFRNELKRIPINTREKIKIVYREYLSDDLTKITASATLQCESTSYLVGAATLSAVAPRLNMTRTGELYAPRDIPMLRGF